MLATLIGKTIRLYFMLSTSVVVGALTVYETGDYNLFFFGFFISLSFMLTILAENIYLSLGEFIAMLAPIAVIFIL